MKKVYIAGQITGKESTYEEMFFNAQKKYFKNDYVMNPAILPAGFSHADYMKICYAMIDACKTVFFLIGWEHSIGANLEYEYAIIMGKEIIYERA